MQCLASLRHGLCAGLLLAAFAPSAGQALDNPEFDAVVHDVPQLAAGSWWDDVWDELDELWDAWQDGLASQQRDDDWDDDDDDDAWNDESAGGSSPARLAIQRVTATGSGCPQNSLRLEVTDGGQRFYVRFLQFQPEVTPNISKVSKSCTLSVYVGVPSGQQFEVKNFSYMGYVYLEKGISADLQALYYFADDRAGGHEVKTTLKGPFDDIYTINDKPSGDGLWSPCSWRETQVLRVELNVSLLNGNPRTDGIVELNEALGVQLGGRKCR